jgi:hypothetical protein
MILTLTIQQESNARINRPAQTAFNLRRKKLS